MNNSEQNVSTDEYMKESFKKYIIDKNKALKTTQIRLQLKEQQLAMTNTFTSNNCCSDAIAYK